MTYFVIRLCVKEVTKKCKNLKLKLLFTLSCQSNNDKDIESSSLIIKTGNTFEVFNLQKILKFHQPLLPAPEKVAATFEFAFKVKHFSDMLSVFHFHQQSKHFH